MLRISYFIAIVTSLVVTSTFCPTVLGRRGYHPPKHGIWNDTYVKLVSRIREYRDSAVPLAKRNLVIFHLGEVRVNMNTLDVATNNVKMFVSAINSHSISAPDKAFYLFNVVDGPDNPLERYLPKEPKNVGCINWIHANDALDLHLRTLKLLTHEIVSSFSAVFFFSHDVRGPLIYRENAQWIHEYRKLLDSNNVGMVGPTFSCENAPHVQTHAFALRTEVVPTLWKVNATFEESGLMLSEFIASRGPRGYNLSSLLYDRRYGQPYFNGKCAPGIGSVMHPTLNPISWCNIMPHEVVFMDWGGEPVRLLGYLCEISIAMMRDTLADMHDSHPELELVVPETLVGGNLVS